jgi:hypothetical protein
VTRIGRFLGAVLIAGSSTQCLLLAESPNVPPEVLVEGPPEVHKSEDAVFSARAVDDRPSGSVPLRWFVREQGCPTSIGEAEQEPQAGTGDSYTVKRTREGAFCVGAIATDAQGARGFSGRRYEVMNQAPVARVVMLTPGVTTPAGTAPTSGPLAVPLYSEVRLTGAMSEDDDDTGRLRYEWKVTPPAGIGQPPACASGGAGTDGPELCRRLDTAGEYRFELTVSDGQSTSEATPMLVSAQPDGLPCFERTEPPHDLARGEDGRPPVVIAPFDRPYTFRVLEVRDDGDPYPTTSGVVGGSFYWQWQEPGAAQFKRLADPTLTSFTVEANRYRPGDEIEIRVDYRDRQPKEAYTCLDDAKNDRCESPAKTGCYHRVSWRLRFIP